MRSRFRTLEDSRQGMVDSARGETHQLSVPSALRGEQGPMAPISGAKVPVTVAKGLRDWVTKGGEDPDQDGGVNCQRTEVREDRHHGPTRQYRDELHDRGTQDGRRRRAEGPEVTRAIDPRP